MELFPALSIGWLNGWLFIAALSLTDAIAFRLFPKPVVERLFDRSGWSRKQITLTVIGKLMALISLVLIALTPLKIGMPVFVIGLVTSVAGLIGLVSALISFRDAPLDQPVTGGLYNVSRHPQIVMSFVVLAGACLAIGSWSALAIQIVSHFFSHLGILGEEDVCSKRYGDSYRAYLKRVPRYFVFF
jgi:protein-S-isoprenylcysteine O-methyltransferase Ste14